MTPNRRPGTAKVEDLLEKADGSPTALAQRLLDSGKPLSSVKRWRVRYVDTDGKQKTMSFHRRVDANKFLKNIVADLMTGRYIDPDDAQIQLGYFYPDYLKSLVKNKQSYQKTRKSVWKNHVAPRWEKTQLGKITTHQVQLWVDDQLEDGKSYDTVYQAATVLRGVLKIAVNDGKLHTNPATKITLGSKPEKPRPYLTPQQVTALADEMPLYSLLIRVLAYCGLRWGELAELRVKDLLFRERRIYITRAVTTPGGKRVVGTPKNGKSRKVPFPPSLGFALQEHVKGMSPDDLVFTTINGKPLDNSNFNAREFGPAVQRCNEADPLFPVELTPHDLRHTAASLAISAGANVLALQRMLGHKKPSITLDVYADLFDSDLDEVATKLEGVIQGF
ncbi:site-specific integrase [Corynebacterium hindlerae]|uniref:tyrosine-type recombinase/integrase n=1 Tax=Corynebacterium hindlerae TaxID=699041 RepID=UPI001AD63D65|nr:site-specific integrase [Corynebacterium hindlerae]QTH60085.1 site-specific integrase [Corynebacterium hindlerae]